MTTENTNTDTNTDAAGDEAARAFAQLDALAAEGSPAAPAAELVDGGELAAPRLPLSQEIAGLLQGLAAVLEPAFPSVGKLYTAETCLKVGAAMEPVCIKHGWLQGGVGGEYGEEIMALVVVGPLAAMTYAGIREDLAERRRKEGEEKVAQAADKRGPAAYAAPGADRVIIGAPA